MCVTNLKSGKGSQDAGKEAKGRREGQHRLNAQHGEQLVAVLGHRGQRLCYGTACQEMKRIGEQKY